MSSLPCLTPSLSPDRMMRRIREPVTLITSSSARVHGRRTKLGIRRRSICVAHFTGLSAVIEPTSEHKNDKADKTFQTDGADNRASGKRCTDWIGGDRKCHGGRSPSKQQRAKQQYPPSLRDQRSA